MEKETINLIVVSASTLMASLAGVFLTYALNKKQIKDNEYKKLVEDIKSFAQQSFNIANENKTVISKSEFIRLTRTLKEYQSYVKALNLSEDEISTSKSLKKLKSIVKKYREDYRKNLINDSEKLDESDSNKQNSGFIYILQELVKINK
ncbi:hypothetical protein [uncultured Haemophilus sp.]|uniref:hypothetical protein n=1 Tax=uncultured Haemophilus sp. TaxID=237779 RepID=UPI00258CA839|nr:hypothetical protein [uncultured Haemophilus sp.]